ncbi:guanine nucleotide-binding protein subunit gamma 1-like [Primulina huaijiensis]|uniref:guanine nucleotide-binding protein subunit gamma 1-like n=1 Tax=Primulina huaijiensis TaxID=1492673 RepID=UPI003CC71BCE
MDSAPPQEASQQPNYNASQPPSYSSSSASAMPRSQGSASMIPGLMGKHRISAAISLLDQQIQIIQDELDELETVDGVSTVCQELISSIESAPDALLPLTKGPTEVGWDRWFQGAQSSRNRRRWI